MAKGGHVVLMHIDHTNSKGHPCSNVELCCEDKHLVAGTGMEALWFLFMASSYTLCFRNFVLQFGD